MTTLSDVSTGVYSGDYRIDALLPTVALHNWNFRSLDLAPVVHTVHYTFVSTNRGSGYKSTFQPYDLMALRWIHGTNPTMFRRHQVIGW